MNYQSFIDVRLKGELGQFSLDVQFQAPMAGVTALFGPSGCGKTTVLRSMAGLQKIPGHIIIGSEQWQTEHKFVPPHKRPVGYVFQEASLFPHLSVHENLCYGLRRVKSGQRFIAEDEVIALLGLDDLIDRRPEHLSGGERQRVSIGRALLSQPRLLLMDEPLSALDKSAKDEILPYFERLSNHLSLPIILVSHDLSEVERLADYLVALRQGKVMSSTTLSAALIDPQLPFSQSHDSAAILPGTIEQIYEDGIVAVDVFGQTILCPGPILDSGAKVRMRIAARDVSLVKKKPEHSSILNFLSARVTGFQTLSPAELNVHLSLLAQPEFNFMARITKRSATVLALQRGDHVIAQIKSVSLTELVSGGVPADKTFR